MITIEVQPRPQSQPDQELLEGLTNLELQEGLLISTSRVGVRPLSQPNQELLEGLANLEFQEGLLALASMGDVHRKPPNPTRNSWKGWPTWNSRKACSLRRVGIAYCRYQPNQELLEGLADLEFQEGPLGAVSERHHS